MRDELVAYFGAHQKVLESSALELILHTPQPLALSRQLLEGPSAGEPVVTREMVERTIARSAERSGAWRRPVDSAPSGVAGAPIEAYRLIAEGFSPIPAGREPLAAYGAMFHSRFDALARMLRGRPELSDLRPVGELEGAGRSASVIAMVREVRQTAEHHHLILTVEDATGCAEVLVPNGSPAAKLPYLTDEVIGLRLLFSRERGRIPRVESVSRPDVAVRPRPISDGRRVRAMFLSDLHVGSRSFLSDAWSRLIEFLNGRGPNPEIAAQVEHVVVAGDLVDGIGVYPDQQRDLAIHDIFQQYHELGRRLRELPSRLNIVVIPGNHDAVSPAEPQPGLPEEIRGGFPANVHSLGNPSTFALDGVVVEAYHGRSFDDLIPALPGASYARPTDVMKRMLAMRHLAPMYGGRTPLAPVARDGLVIDPAPNILVTGHAHTFGVDQYRGVRLLNASAWQSETEYQRMRNISPVPAHAAIVDLVDLSTIAVDFSPVVPVIGGTDA